MTTEYRDANGKLLRTDKGTRPRNAVPSPAPAPRANAPTSTTDAAPSAKKEK